MAAQNDAGRTVSEEGGRDEHGQAWIIDPVAERAKVDGEKEDVRAGPRLCHARGPRETTDATPATQPEDRKPLHGRTDGETVHQPGFEARDRKSGDRVGDDDVDIAHRKAGLVDGLLGDPLQKIKRVFLIDGSALLPGARLEVPLLRLDRVARVDAGVGVERIEARAAELRVDLLRALGCFGLPEHVLRYRCCDRSDFNFDRSRGGTVNPSAFDLCQHESEACLFGPERAGILCSGD